MRPGPFLTAAAPGNCFRTDTLSLNDDRFRVEIAWRDFQGGRGPGIAFPRTDDAGTFFFFDPDNAELLLKVLDVEFTLTVTDTLSNQSRVYDNPLGRPVPAIIDTQAFATCP